MASSPAVPFKRATPFKPLGQGEVKRRMQQTTARSGPRGVADFAAVPLPDVSRLHQLKNVQSLELSYQVPVECSQGTGRADVQSEISGLASSHADK